MNINSILNLLTVLKQEPKNKEQLWESNCFYSWKNLEKTLMTCFKVGLVRIEYFGRRSLDAKEVMSQTTLHSKRWHKKIYCYYLTDLGLAFLSFYSRHRIWQPK